MALIRPFAFGLLLYAAIAVCYPDWNGQAYHAMMLSLIAGGAVGVWALGVILDLGVGAAKIALELAFLVLLALFVGFTMPQKSGRPPLQQWAEGSRPTRASARRGLERLGVDPNGRAASKIIALLPKR